MESDVVVCPRCHAKNRVRSSATGAPHCAKCGTALPWLTDAGEASFNDVVEHSPLPVLVDLWAPWCGPCRMVEPVVRQMSRDLAGRLKVVRVDVDEAPGLQQRFRVMGIPTLLLIDGGTERDRMTGAVPASALRSWLDARLPPAPVSRPVSRPGAAPTP